MSKTLVIECIALFGCWQRLYFILQCQSVHGLQDKRGNKERRKDEKVLRFKIETLMGCLEQFDRKSRPWTSLRTELIELILVALETATPLHYKCSPSSIYYGLGTRLRGLYTLSYFILTLVLQIWFSHPVFIKQYIV